MQISDSSSRILAGLLEARTGQQLTMSRRWRLETALSQLLRERGIASIDELITILVMGRDGVDGAAALVSAGGAVLGQDDATRAVWGMPREVDGAGLAAAILWPEKLARPVASRIGQTHENQ